MIFGQILGEKKTFFSIKSTFFSMIETLNLNVRLITKTVFENKKFRARYIFVQACSFFATWLKMLINDIDIKPVLKCKNSIGKYHPVLLKDP